MCHPYLLSHTLSLGYWDYYPAALDTHTHTHRHTRHGCTHKYRHTPFSKCNSRWKKTEKMESRQVNNVKTHTNRHCLCKQLLGHAEWSHYARSKVWYKDSGHNYYLIRDISFLSILVVVAVLMSQQVDTALTSAYQQESDGPCCDQIDQCSAGYSVAVIENILFPDKSAWK